MASVANNSEGKVLEIKTVQIAPFIILMTALKDILLETNICFTRQGIKIINMYTILLSIAVVLSVIIIILILMQQGKGSETGAIFGGGSSSVFGAMGASTFLSKLTAFLVFLFFINCLFLAYLAKNNLNSDSVLKKEENLQIEESIENKEEIEIPD